MLNSDFTTAIHDYLFLLENHYSQKSIIKLIGDRYQLSGIERSILYRGIVTSSKARSRKKKLWIKSIRNQKLHIDGYNVLYTIGSYLNGNLVFLSNDGVLRDASEIHGKILRTVLIDRSIKLIIDFCKLKRVDEVNFYLDTPMSKSAILSKKIYKLIHECGFNGSSKTIDSPDFFLKNLDSGICCTSDSVIIDKVSVPVFDLAKHVLQYYFSPSFKSFKKFSH